MAKVRAIRVRELTERVANGPAVRIMPSDWAELGISDHEQARAIERHFANHYRNWQASWVHDELADLLKR